MANKIRKEILPILNSIYNGADSRIASLANRLECYSEDQQFFAKIAILKIIERAASTRVLFIRSDTPFCCGEYGAQTSCHIPFCLRKFLNLADVYSPIPSTFKY